MGKPLNKVYPHATRWQVIKYQVRKTTIQTLSVIILLMIPVGAYFIGEAVSSAETISVVTPIVQSVAPTFPVLDRIAKAESNNSQFCTAELAASKMCPTSQIGGPLIHLNTNGTFDVGKYQINSIWIAQAVKMHYDIFNSEDDNRSFAEWLFENQGSVPWSSSSSRWNN